ncbi:Deoxycytidylate deaminase [Sulfitobacter marinus]|uniref:Deoxycytidylate deaminase n=1 Tax=Sulfitobacter marinus TaxID=394264 RepID=A0A1I6RTQ2_9RHOB|nr:anti-phage dCTP deaminase [Sulfitobacter marinus]SFS68097.1 Deoxycytidylate deaminase [Sulfitobacter marinus]
MPVTKLNVRTTEPKETVKTAEKIARARSKELFFGVVGPVGAGGSRVIASLERVCEEAGYEVAIIKASTVIRTWAADQNPPKSADAEDKLATVEEMQNLGDDMRKKDTSEVALGVLREIAKTRAEAQNLDYHVGEAVAPDDKKRVYLIDSIRHPSETNVFRRIYGSSFALLGVVCEEPERVDRILGKYFTKPEAQQEANKERVRAFVKRDADDSEKSYGQHVTDAFFEADFFINNTEVDPVDEKQLLDEKCSRLVDIISHSKVVRPTIDETAMHHAHSARVRSSCLSRQVGASLVDKDGTIIATGANEVPAAGGGVYGEGSGPLRNLQDHRCVFRSGEKFCSSNREQNRIIDELINAIPELKGVDDRESLRAKLRKTSVGGLLEFSRAVHAEMDALLSAGREGFSTVGTRLFVTTYPCHYCARHIVSAGVYEVQYIEPYPKSLATDLHGDSIEVDTSKWVPPMVLTTHEEHKSADKILTDAAESTNVSGKMLIHPFVGVAPRLYLKAFEKTWRLKDKVSGNHEMSPPEWGDEWSSLTMGYPELEAALTK